MIRASKHILKYQTNSKSSILEGLYHNVLQQTQYYIDLIWEQALPLKDNLSSKDLPNYLFQQSHWKQICYKHASTLIRSNKAKKKTSKPVLKNIGILLDSRVFDISSNSAEFDHFVRIHLPFLQENLTNRYQKINIPLKHHKHSLKFKDWRRKDTIRLLKRGRFFFIEFLYEKEAPVKKSSGVIIGIDQGYKKLAVTSDGEFIGQGFPAVYEKISRKRQGSKAFARALVERNNLINQQLNNLELSSKREIVIEDLKGVKYGTRGKIRKSFNNKLQRWVYSKVVTKLEMLCEENGVLLTKINPAYTSQRCSSCGAVDKKSRNGEKFLCTSCGFELDADLNAAKNISTMGVYNPHT